MSWIYSEDASLKLHLQGLTVQDANSPAGGRKVLVRYRKPEEELAKLSYPIIIIDFLGIFPASDREHRSGPITLPYAPEGYSQWCVPGQPLDVTKSPYEVPYYPVPFNLDYQVTVYSRLARSHHFPLMARMLQPDKLPYHFGALFMPQDGTVRTMELLGGPDTGYLNDENGKRLFRNTMRVRVFTELIGTVTDLREVPLVQKLTIDLSCYYDSADLTPESAKESIGIIGAKVPFSWNTVSP